MREVSLTNPCRCPGTRALPWIRHFVLLCDCSVPVAPPPIFDPMVDLDPGMPGPVVIPVGDIRPSLSTNQAAIDGR